MKTCFYWLKLPLLHPYSLSFKTIEEYDSFIFLIKTKDDTYWGESTALYGYSWETAESIWETIVNCINQSQNDLQKLKIQVENLVSIRPFASSAVLTAIEKYYNLTNYRNFSFEKGIPLVGTIRGNSSNELISVANELAGSGYKVLKVKLSKDVDNDIRKIKIIQNELNSDIKLRLDANQSYSSKMVEYLFSKIRLENIELLEQPFERGAYHLVESLVKWSPIPIMLDESIWTFKDIEKAKECGADYVKLKVVKHGSIINTLTLAEKAGKLGLKVILGNGVQSDFGCIDECYAYKLANLKEAGEMNGFLKLKTSLLPSSIFFKDGIVSVNVNNVEKEAKNVNLINNYVLKKYTLFMKA